MTSLHEKVTKLKLAWHHRANYRQSLFARNTELDPTLRETLMLACWRGTISRSRRLSGLKALLGAITTELLLYGTMPEAMTLATCFTMNQAPPCISRDAAEALSISYEPKKLRVCRNLILAPNQATPLAIYSGLTALHC